MLSCKWRSALMDFWDYISLSSPASKMIVGIAARICIQGKFPRNDDLRRDFYSLSGTEKIQVKDILSVWKPGNPGEGPWLLESALIEIKISIMAISSRYPETLLWSPLMHWRKSWVNQTNNWTSQRTLVNDIESWNTKRKEENVQRKIKKIIVFTMTRHYVKALGLQRWKPIQYLLSMNL